jgi:predicted N-acetyltransferase YhbS
MDWRIRPEYPSDRAAVREVHELAFGGTVEADLVDALGEGAIRAYRWWRSARIASSGTFC